MRKFTRSEARQADDGIQPEFYTIFQCRPTTAGITKRGKSLYLRHSDGRLKVDESGNRIRDDQIRTVPDQFQRFLDGTLVKSEI